MKIKVTGFLGILDKEEIRKLFAEYGVVEELEKAYGTNIAYLKMPYDYQGLKAIHSLDGTKLFGRVIKVEECV